VQTPALDQLTKKGIRYNNFHTTAWGAPLRASLLTGRRPAAAGFDADAQSADSAPGYGYAGVWKKSAASIAQVLRYNGYSTAAFGTWLNTPYREATPLGPFDRWPTSLGFEHFYGLMTSGQMAWMPTLYRGTVPEEAQERSEPAQFVADVATEAVRWLHTHESLAPEKPYFLYLATGAAKTPRQVPGKWLEQYRGKFNQGWDKLREEIFARQKKLGIVAGDAVLTARPEELLAWDSLSAADKSRYAGQMESYAAYLAYTDSEIGRVLKVVQEYPSADNTLVFFIIGHSSPIIAGPLYNNIEASSWAWALNTPFNWVRQMAANFTGARTPMVAVWPRRIRDQGGLRGQYTHVSDIVATLYEATGVQAPSMVDGEKQSPLDGISFASTFDNPTAPARRTEQVYDQAGNREIYRDGWMAAAFHYSAAWWVDSNESAADSGMRWSLYHVEQDFSEAHDVAAQYPDKLKELKALFATKQQKHKTATAAR
jgi:arylsulfatase